jgi:hypothetical protein
LPPARQCDGSVRDFGSIARGLERSIQFVAIELALEFDHDTIGLGRCKGNIGAGNADVTD